MAQTIWKFPLQTTDEQVISIPKQHKLLTVQLQNGEPCLWAAVNPDSEKEDVKILTYGTGHPIPDSHFALYMGTYQLKGGVLVFHVFAEAGAYTLL